MIVADFNFEIAIRRDLSNGKLRPCLFCRHTSIPGTGFHGFVEAEDLEKLGLFLLNEGNRLSEKKGE